ncbi:hypothetical protein BSKO_04362 [Bryopsis sp. KO-2023]|nr:hypothetical protein BSKO_04362 [Bryopsis sp. KO-2023]
MNCGVETSMPPPRPPSRARIFNPTKNSSQRASASSSRTVSVHGRQSFTQEEYTRPVSRASSRFSAQSTRKLNSSQNSDAHAKASNKKTQKSNKETGRIHSESLVRRRLYTPGPGAYEPRVDRKGTWTGRAFSFGGSDRSFIKSHVSTVSSPGPIYLPTRELSINKSAPAVEFPRQQIGTRYNLEEGQFQNSPFWNPGPGEYSACKNKDGTVVTFNVATDGTKIGTSNRHRPEDNLKGIRLDYEDQLRENIGVFSPGPIYFPSSMQSQFSPRGYSFRRKCKSMWEDMTHPFKIFGPGPIYDCDQVDKKGTRYWEKTPVPCFGKEHRFWEPELRLSGTPYLSEEHAHRANYSIHSPGLRYDPKFPAKHKSAPAFHMCGNKDRFYTRQELQRIE